MSRDLQSSESVFKNTMNEIGVHLSTFWQRLTSNTSTTYNTEPAQQIVKYRKSRNKYRRPSGRSGRQQKTIVSVVVRVEHQ